MRLVGIQDVAIGFAEVLALARARTGEPGCQARDLMMSTDGVAKVSGFGTAAGRGDRCFRRGRAAQRRDRHLPRENLTERRLAP